MNSKTTSNDVLIYLKLDSILKSDNQATVPDSSGNDNAAIVHGSPKLVPDEMFGSCLRFNHSKDKAVDYLELPAASKIFGRGWTFSIWMYLEKMPETDDVFSLVWAALSTNNTYGVGINSDRYLVLDMDDQKVASADQVKLNSWVHVAIAVQADGQASLWLDGQNIEGTVQVADENAAHKVTIGGYEDTYPSDLFQGKMANIRIYNRALATQEIQQQRSQDLWPSLGFQESSPLDFKLWDEQQKGAIYVEGGEISHKLTVPIWNRDPGKRPLVLEGMADEYLKIFKRMQALQKRMDLVVLSVGERDILIAAMPEPQQTEIKKIFSDLGGDGEQKLRHMQDAFFVANHHLELRFPKGTLSKKAIAWLQGDLDRLLAKKELLGENTWYIQYQEHYEQNDESLYLLYPEKSTIEASNVENEKPGLEIVLPHIATGIELDGQVLPIELRPGPLAKHPDDPATFSPRICTVEVLSQVGQKYIPLHFDVVGSNTVLNDGEAKTALLLRITNIDREVSIPIHRKGNRQTRFILACEITDQGEHAEWALTDQAAKVTVQMHLVSAIGAGEPKPDVDGDWDSDPIMASTNGRMVEWVIDGERLGVESLKPNASVYLRLEVQTGLRTGPTDVHFYYRHVTGYWDGSRSCTVQKSPLLFNRPFHALIQNSDDKKLSILPGSICVYEFSITFGGTSELKDFAKTLSNQVYILSINFPDIDAFHDFCAKNKIELKPESSSVHCIFQDGKEEHLKGSVCASTDLSRAADLEGLVPQLATLLGYSPLWSPREYIGIGTNQPASKLAVTEGLTIGSGWAEKYKAPENGLLVQGQVGIGVVTPDPMTKLHVHGGRLRISETINSAVLELKNDKHTNYLYTDSRSGHIHLLTNSTNHHVVLQKCDGQGNVGIGTDDPKEKLEVNGRIKGILSGDDLMPKSIDLNKLAEAVQQALCPVGTILSYYGKKAPHGWLLCNGSDIPDKPQFKIIRDFIGLTKGLDYQYPFTKEQVTEYLAANPSKSINDYINTARMIDKSIDKYVKIFCATPDLRGRFLRGVDAGLGRDPDSKDRKNAAGEKVGDVVGSIQEDAIKSHTHIYTRPKSPATVNHDKDAGQSAFHNGSLDTPTSTIADTTPVQETRPKNIYVNFIIKY